jgi:hypothetical protein
MGLVFILSYSQHWIRCQPDHLCGDAAVKHVCEAGTAMGAHDDEISPTLARHAYNRVPWGPGRDSRLPRAVEAMAHEVTEVRQGRLIVSLEHNSWLWWAGGTTAALQGRSQRQHSPRGA